MRSLTALLLLFIFSLQASAQPEFLNVNTLTDWEEVVQVAKVHRRLIYVYYTANDCETCSDMERNSFKNNELTDYFNDNYINVKLVSGTSFARQFAQAFQIGNVPSSLWLMDNEFVWKMEVGLLKSSELLQKAKEVGQLTKAYPTLLPYALNDGDTLRIDQWSALFNIAGYNQLSYERQLISSFKRNLKLDSLTNEAYWPFVMTYVSNLSDPIFQYIRIDWQTALGEDFLWMDYYDNLYDFNMNIAIQTEDSVLVETIQHQLLTTYVSDSTESETEKDLRVLFLWQDYFGSLGKLDTYVTTTDEMLEYIKPDANQLVEIITQLTKRTRSISHLDKAITWLDDAIAREPEVDLYIMKADIQLILYRRRDALETIEEGMELPMTEHQRDLLNYLQFTAQNGNY